MDSHGAMAAEIVELRAEVARLTEALGREHETARLYMDINHALREENNELDNRLVVARELLRYAATELRRASVTVDGMPSVSHNLLCNIDAALAEQEGGG